MSRRLQVIPEETDDPTLITTSSASLTTSNLYAGVGYRLAKTVLVNSILLACHSEASSDFVRSVFMKLFH
eukprot:CAMPEP_0178850516 /NCGR_PEP_ID=MMETSP0746-20121128/20579_1 /TAXON_ID=913974 /ORGANISM="Nitzschia punctata, Strain CCMP561" /LENGTH=69 /DNA_ID=CAMNT_0020515917 /DNA_START=264 /DNA_END=473 /DNA_ORIENTATION=-